jgi:predicted HicB family RNase H-like nuclease
MSKDASLRLPHSIKKAAQRLAKEGGVSLNRWIALPSHKRSESWKLSRLRPLF